MALRRRPEGADDGEVFLTAVYARLLGRRPDPAGRAEFLGQLARGGSPADIVMQIAQSEEFAQRTLLRRSPRRRRSDRYRLAIDVDGEHAHWVFEATADQDFDWLESILLDDGYFDRHRNRRPVAEDVMSDAVEQFLPAHPLELSHLERDDVIDLDARYDLVHASAVFERLNPNRLSRYLDTLRARVLEGGWLVAAIPAFGTDPVFGEALPLYLREWYDDVAAHRPFRAVHSDDDGYPRDGQLIWAHTSWWVDQFEQSGFARRPDVERALSERYRAHLERERRTYYVFCAGDSAPQAASVISRMATGV
jgi:hypothetical protein